MRWVKVWTTLRHHPLLRRCSVEARLIYRVCLEIAGDFEQGGALAARGPNGRIPMTVAEIAREVDVAPKACAKALNDLLEIGFLEREPDGSLVIPKFDEKTESASAARMRRHRASVTPSVTVTRTNQNSDASRDVYAGVQEVEGEEEVDIQQQQRAGAREAVSGDDRKAPPARSAAWSFGIEFFKAGAAATLVPPHVADFPALAHGELPVFEALVAAYGVDECRMRMSRLIERSTARKKNNEPLSRFCGKILSEFWDTLDGVERVAKPRRGDADRNALSDKKAAELAQATAGTDWGGGW